MDYTKKTKGYGTKYGTDQSSYTAQTQNNTYLSQAKQSKMRPCCRRGCGDCPYK